MSKFFHFCHTNKLNRCMWVSPSMSPAHYTCPCSAQPAPMGTRFRFRDFLVGKQGPETGKGTSYSF